MEFNATFEPEDSGENVAMPTPTVLGAVFRGLRPFADFYLPLDPGLTVLYGLNGVGKTRILKALGDSRKGVDSPSSLLVRVPPPVETGSITAVSFLELQASRLPTALPRDHRHHQPICRRLAR